MFSFSFSKQKCKKIYKLHIGKTVVAESHFFSSVCFIPFFGPLHTIRTLLATAKTVSNFSKAARNRPVRLLLGQFSDFLGPGSGRQTGDSLRQTRVVYHTESMYPWGSPGSGHSTQAGQTCGHPLGVLRPWESHNL